MICDVRSLQRTKVSTAQCLTLINLDQSERLQAFVTKCLKLFDWLMRQRLSKISNWKVARQKSHRIRIYGKTSASILVSVRKKRNKEDLGSIFRKFRSVFGPENPFKTTMKRLMCGAFSLTNENVIFGERNCECLSSKCSLVQSSQVV